MSKNRTLIINWDNNWFDKKPEIFKNIKSTDAAMKILSKRDIYRIKSATYAGKKLIVEKPLSL